MDNVALTSSIFNSNNTNGTNTNLEEFHQHNPNQPNLPNNTINNNNNNNSNSISDNLNHNNSFTQNNTNFSYNNNTNINNNNNNNNRSISNRGSVKKSSEATLFDEQNRISRKNTKNFINKITKPTVDGVISPIENTSEEYISANQVANKLYTNQSLKSQQHQQGSMSSNSITAVVNINNNNNQQQYINPMANHSNKNAYPVLAQSGNSRIDEQVTPVPTQRHQNGSSNNHHNSSTNKRNNDNGNMPSSANGDQQMVEKHNLKSKPIAVESRIVFLKVGQIDTRNERYDAEAYIECSWHDDAMFKLLTTNNSNASNSTPAMQSDHRFINVAGANQSTSGNAASVNALKTILKNISNFEYDPNQHWSPQLYIENAIGDLKEEVRHKVEIVEKVNTTANNMKVTPENVSKYMSNFTVRVCEMRKLRGVFYERLELNDFPMDIQELSITLTSKRSNQEVEVVENKENPCSINTEDFLDQQEWDLFSYVKTTTKTINDPWRKYDRSGFSVTAFIARKPGYYLYNAYMLIFLITVLGFVPFAFDPASPQFRAQVTGLLLLTSVNFRWIVTQRLPSVPYLTSLDKYAIGSLLFLVCFCVWHSLIGSSIITTTNRKTIDTYVLYGLAGLFLIYNGVYVIWFVKMDRTIKNFKEKCQLQQILNVNAAKEQAAKNSNTNNNNNNNNNNNQTTNNNNNLKATEINDSNSNIANGVTANRSPLSNGVVISNNSNFVLRNNNNNNSKQQRTPVHDTTLLMTSA